jgi:hypothetical protein
VRRRPSQRLERLKKNQPAPRDARLIIDVGYIAAAAGLLATIDAALGLLRNQAPALGL